MDQTKRDSLADTVGTDVGRTALLEEIVGKVDGPGSDVTDEELDLWWGTVESDRLASGLTLAAIAKFSERGDGDEPAGPWLEKSDATGDEPTRLTAEGRDALRRIVATR